MKDKKKIFTFGCRLNTYESEVINSLTSDFKNCNTVIFNTCAVTNEAIRKVKQKIRKIKKENPLSEITVTGCAAQIEPKTFLGILVLGSTIPTCLWLILYGLIVLKKLNEFITLGSKSTIN